jgi:GNAT superfamily N-acetyltransferase
MTDHTAAIEHVPPDVTFDVIDPRSPEARSVIDRYFAELDARFRAGFDPGPGGAAADADTMRGPTGAFVVAHEAGQAIGCGGVIRVDDGTAEIKRMWISPDHRGRGLGRRLLAHLETVAAGLGHHRVVLDTNESLGEAIAMYGRSGYRAIERYNDNPYAHHWFAKELEPEP